ncbi:MAG: VCBS repeat-containing protein, partial [Thermoanaerobaculia bacterium]|nr:VCBS repeat-containing protein [Thermoanaerobaculia bacterium]
RRAVAVHRALADGRFDDEPLRLELPESVHALLPGPPAAPLLAWTDEGVAELALLGGALALVPRVATPSPLAGSRAFLPDLRLVADLDGDGLPDLLLPTADGLDVHLAGPDGLAPVAASRVPYALEERLPGDARHYRRGAVRQLPLPDLADLDGDRLPELVFREHERGFNRLRVARNLGGGRFSAAIDPLAGRARDAEPEIVWIGDLDGDGRGELVSSQELASEDDSMRAEMREAKQPRHRYGLHALDADLVWNPEPRRSFEIAGHLFGAGASVLGLPDGLAELDGDGRVDLVALKLDFSLLQAVRVMTARSLRLGLDFEVHCQLADGGFRAVANADLGGKFTLRLDRLRLGRLSSFGGDFDGDGRADFLQLGRGREVTVRFGSAGCQFPAAGQAVVRLAAEPADLALVRVGDLDGDGRSDLSVTEPPRPGAVGGRGALDLYLSRGAP